MEPTVLVGGAIMLLMMLGGGKKGGKHGPLDKGDKPTPLPDGHDKGGSDGLPDGSKHGHLPKGKGYAPPADMTTTDLWVSPDCQAYVVGEDWYPTVEGMDPYVWFKTVYNEDAVFTAGTPQAQWMEHVNEVFYMLRDEADAANRDFILFEGNKYDLDFWAIPAYYFGRFNDMMSPADAVATLVLREASPLCEGTMPLMGDYETEDDFSDAWEEWAARYPALADVYWIIRESAVDGELPVGLNQGYPKSGEGEGMIQYEGARNLQNAWYDSIGAIGGDVVVDG